MAEADSLCHRVLRWRLGTLHMPPISRFPNGSGSRAPEDRSSSRACPGTIRSLHSHRLDRFTTARSPPQGHTEIRAPVGPSGPVHREEPGGVDHGNAGDGQSQVPLHRLRLRLRPGRGRPRWRHQAGNFVRRVARGLGMPGLRRRPEGVSQTGRAGREMARWVSISAL